MDKDWKLQRYSRKDYTDVVDFPVEIVGRDGVVRRYSFEDSIRLYQRRITFAPIRYRDTELVDAEVSHCRSRIEQLRRSYYHRFGWGTPDGEPEPLEVFGDLAGELAAFVCRVFRCEGRPDVVITSVADAREPVSTWYVMPPGAQSGLVLYVFRFDGEQDEAIRERFFGLLRSLDRVDEEGDNERMIAFHHTVDCGFALTTRAGEEVRLADLRGESSDPDIEPTAWDALLEVIRRGDFQEGAALCRRLVTEQPYHRSAYVAGAVLSAALRRYWDTEDFAMVGAAYFAEDAVLHQYTGLARYRLGRLGEAEETLREAVRLAPHLASARFLLANVLVDQGRIGEARRVLAEGRAVKGDSRRSDVSLRRLEQWLRWRRVMSAGAAASFTLGLLALLTGGWIGLVPVIMSLVIAVAGTLVFRRQLDDLRGRQRYDELSQGLRRVHRRLRVQGAPVC